MINKINQEIIEVEKGCGKWNEEVRGTCGKKYRDAPMMLCPECKSKLTQLKKFKKILEQLECDKIEELAELEHQQWSNWAKYFLLEKHTDEDRERWAIQMNTDYKDLSEEDKEKDRKWARKVIENLFHSNKQEKKENDTNKKGIDYKCGHKGNPVILDSNELSVASYLEWKDSVGYDGDKSMCWECYCQATDKLNNGGKK